LMAMPPVFFFLKLMLGGLRFRRMPTYGAGQQVRSKQQRHRQVCGCVGGWGGRAGTARQLAERPATSTAH
jgi:hypothetical protein